MLEIPSFCEKIIFDLLVRGFIPIISHPERNRECVHQPSSLFRLVELGALIQLNAGSVLGIYGKRVQEVAKLFLSHNLIHFIASDLHSQKDTYILLRAVEEAAKIVGEARALELVSSAPERVIKNETLIIYEPLPYKEKSSFFFWRK
jgi:protein-tyrosine phosphatase